MCICYCSLLCLPLMGNRSHWWKIRADFLIDNLCFCNKGRILWGLGTNSKTNYPPYTSMFGARINGVDCSFVLANIYNMYLFIIKVTTLVIVSCGCRQIHLMLFYLLFNPIVFLCYFLELGVISLYMINNSKQPFHSLSLFQVIIQTVLSSPKYSLFSFFSLKLFFHFLCFFFNLFWISFSLNLISYVFSFIIYLSPFF